MISVLFVCLGNICRSPMAEGVFQQLVDDAELRQQIQVDSCGTGSWHAGEKAHAGTRKVLQAHGIPYNGRSRVVTDADMSTPNSYVVAMDDSNVADLQRRFGTQTKIYKLLDFAQNSDVTNVPDPYYTGNFEVVYQLVRDGCEGLLATIRQEAGL